MKRNMIFSAVLLGSLLLSCSSKKQVANSQDMETVTKENTEDTNEAYAQNVGVAEADTDKATSVIGSGGTMNNVLAKSNTFDDDGFDYDRLYTALKMTDDQIRQFQMAMKNFSTQQVSTPSGEMMGTIADERERQLENILTEGQLETYRSMD